jgi:hypothetical protein
LPGVRDRITRFVEGDSMSRKATPMELTFSGGPSKHAGCWVLVDKPLT